MEHTCHLCSFKGRYVVTPYLEVVTLSLFNLFSSQFEVLAVFCFVAEFMFLANSEGGVNRRLSYELEQWGSKYMKIGGIKENE